jgi:hypothetical protein
MPDREQNADSIAAVLNKYSQLVLL